MYTLTMTALKYEEREVLFACSNFYKSTAYVVHAPLDGEFYDVIFETGNQQSKPHYVVGFDKACNFAMWLAS